MPEMMPMPMPMPRDGDEDSPVMDNEPPHMSDASMPDGESEESGMMGVLAPHDVASEMPIQARDEPEMMGDMTSHMMTPGMPMQSSGPEPDLRDAMPPHMMMSGMPMQDAEESKVTSDISPQMMSGMPVFHDEEEQEELSLPPHMMMPGMPMQEMPDMPMQDAEESKMMSGTPPHTAPGMPMPQGEDQGSEMMGVMPLHMMTSATPMQDMPGMPMQDGERKSEMLNAMAPHMTLAGMPTREDENAPEMMGTMPPHMMAGMPMPDAGMPLGGVAQAPPPSSDATPMAASEGVPEGFGPPKTASVIESDEAFEDTVDGEQDGRRGDSTEPHGAQPEARFVDDGGETGRRELDDVRPEGGATADDEDASARLTAPDDDFHDDDAVENALEDEAAGQTAPGSDAFSARPRPVPAADESASDAGDGMFDVRPSVPIRAEGETAEGEQGLGHVDDRAEMMSEEMMAAGSTESSSPEHVVPEMMLGEEFGQRFRGDDDALFRQDQPQPSPEIFPVDEEHSFALSGEADVVDRFVDSGVAADEAHRDDDVDGGDDDGASDGQSLADPMTRQGTADDEDGEDVAHSAMPDEQSS
ncbi:uncharacterized protein LOC119091345 [Pollicipes pollicipes]|uniref:uncharacterized protein LOC119091345 n=1 Tax=Pollicipes pollicipes TaxID=41117 RepID=UPI001884C0C7|nr:uncharacterized protein LOC119091345 [Pollicipes pollicipes]